MLCIRKIKVGQARVIMSLPGLRVGSNLLRKTGQSTVSILVTQEQDTLRVRCFTRCLVNCRVRIVGQRTGFLGPGDHGPAADQKGHSPPASYCWNSVQYHYLSNWPLNDLATEAILLLRG